MVYGFARQSGGAALISSAPDQGTTVHLLFPQAEEEAAPRASAPRASERPETETILVVDDRPEVAELARAILEGLGYTVILAHDGREAMEIIRSGRAFDMLFTDLIMPGGMNGVMLARGARRVRIILDGPTGVG